MAKLKRRPRYEEDEYDEDAYEEDDYDEDDYDDNYDNEGSSLKKWLIMGLVIAFIIVGGIGIRLVNQGKSNAEKPKIEQVSKPTKKPKTAKTEKAEEPPVETLSSDSAAKNEQRATTSLERPEVPSTEEEHRIVQEHITMALDKLVNATPEYVNNQESGLFLTTYTSLSALRMLLGNGYATDVSSLKTYKSNNDNVLQFTIAFNKEGHQPVYFTGNYTTTTEQLDFAHLHGEPANAVSVNHNPDAQVPSSTLGVEVANPEELARLEEETRRLTEGQSQP